MEILILQKEQFNLLLEKVEKIESALFKSESNSDDEFIDNVDFMQMYKVSRRTLQEWRSQGLIAYSQIGNKIFYKKSDISKFLESHKQHPFNQKRSKTR